MINVGVIGCGQWGPNHVRNFSHLPNSKALMCADLDENRLKVMKSTFLNIRPTTDYREILKNDEVDAVVLCVINFQQCTRGVGETVPTLEGCSANAVSAEGGLAP